MIRLLKCVFILFGALSHLIDHHRFISNLFIADIAENCPFQVSKKIQKAKTDSIVGITYDHEARPELANLIDLYSAFSNMTPQEIVQIHQSHNILQFKTALSEAINATVGPISTKLENLKKDPSYIDHIAAIGAKEANAQAQETLSLIRPLVGYL